MQWKGMPKGTKAKRQGPEYVPSEKFNFFVGFHDILINIARGTTDLGLHTAHTAPESAKRVKSSEQNLDKMEA